MFDVSLSAKLTNYQCCGLHCHVLVIVIQLVQVF